MPRESSFLPTIKCSQCGNQVEISMMGDHICNGADAQCELKTYLIGTSCLGDQEANSSQCLRL
jgi:hypothetical protein